MSAVKSGELQVPIDLTTASLFLDADIAGTVSEFKVNGIGMELLMPEFTEYGDPKEHRFETSFEKYRLDTDPWRVRPFGLESFGRVVKSDWEGQSSIPTHIHIEKLIVRSLEQVEETQVLGIVNGCQTITNRMVEWIEVLTFNSFESDNIGTQHSSGLTPFLVTADGNRSDQILAAAVMPVSLNFPRMLPNLRDLRAALKKSELGEDPDAIHFYLISGLRHHKMGDYRSAVFDVATALELALFRKAQSLLPKLSDKEMKKFQNRIRGVAALRDAVEFLGGGAHFTQEELASKLSSARNQAIHGGMDVTRESSEVAIHFVKDFVYSTFPPETVASVVPKSSQRTRRLASGQRVSPPRKRGRSE